jgi:hypothetical protein
MTHSNEELRIKKGKGKRKERQKEGDLGIKN